MLTPALLFRAYLFLGGFEALAAMTAFVVVLPRAGYIPATTACLGAIVVMQIVNVHLCRSTRKWVFTSARRLNALIVAGIVTEIVLMLAIAYTPVGRSMPAHDSSWFAAAMLAAEELRKWIVRASARPENTTACPRGHTSVR